MNKNRGVTLISLVITIIILLIIAGISVYSGKDIIKKAQLEELKTNMLLIEAKAKQYVEEANFKMGINPDDAKKSDVRTEVYINTAKLAPASDMTIDSSIPTSECYKLTQEAIEAWGLNEIEVEEGEYYLIQFKDTITAENTSLLVEVYNTKGYKGKYSLTDIEQIEEYMGK